MHGQHEHALRTTESSEQTGLFIIWERSREHQDRIIEDLARRFDLLHTYEIHWTPGLVARNFRRFYSDIDIRGVSHQHNKGGGAFIAVTLVDRNPMMAERMTTRGVRHVNVHFLDAKTMYREWSDPFGVHSGENDWENTRDITMLLGEDPEAHRLRSTGGWSGRLEPIHRDLAGAWGWSSADELFGVLRPTVSYVLLCEGDLGTAPRHGTAPLEFLTDRYSDFLTITNAGFRSGLASAHGGRAQLSIGGRPVDIRVRHVNDRVFDGAWARENLARRVLDPAGRYRLQPRDAVEVFAYRALIHKPSVEDQDQEALSRLAFAAGEGPAPDLRDPVQARAFLDERVVGKGREILRPADQAVYFNYHRIGHPWPRLWSAVDAGRAAVEASTRLVTGRARSAYLTGRDRLLVAAPWLRRIRRRVSG